MDLERELAERMAEAERIVGFGVWRWEIDSGVVRWSDELHHIYGLHVGAFPGTVEGYLCHLVPQDRDHVWANVQRSIETQEPFVFEERIIRADGQERVLLSQGRPIPGPDGAITAIVGVCQDVTARAHAERALGLSERRMRAILDNAPSIITVKDLGGSYLMVNAECEQVLGTPDENIVGRRCADVFPASVSERQRANDRRAAAEGEAVYDEAVLIRDGEPRTYVSATFCLPDDAGRPEATCTIATDFTERKQRDAELRKRLDCSDRIESALHNGDMLIYAQPIVALPTGTPASCELLIRMRTSGQGAVLEPKAFLPAAERYGLVQSIDLWMVRQALRLADFRDVGVNLSAVTLGDAAARREIIALLTAAPEAAARTVFELTETAVLENLDAAVDFAAELKAHGCGLALDDFGTGFGSLIYLRRLPLRFLKIDQMFVRDLVHSPDDQRLVRIIIRIAEEFGLSTIAEGVEDQQTLELLAELGTDYAQGFYLGRPDQVQPQLGDPLPLRSAEAEFNATSGELHVSHERGLVPSQR